MSLIHDYEKALEKFIKKQKEVANYAHDVHESMKDTPQKDLPDKFTELFNFYSALRQFNMYAMHVLKTNDHLEEIYARTAAMIYYVSDEVGRAKIEGFRERFAEQLRLNKLDEVNKKHDELYYGFLKEIESKFSKEK